MSVVVGGEKSLQQQPGITDEEQELITVEELSQKLVGYVLSEERA